VRAIVILANVPQMMVAAQGRNLLVPQYALDLAPSGGPAPIPLLIARDSSAIEVLRAAGEDLAALRDSSTHAIRPLTGVTVTLSARRRVIGEATAPNVVGVLPGSDPALAGEYLFFTGHMDHIGVVGGGQGCAAIGADSICNGADDDASGTIGVVELAKAFSQLTPRPRRTLVFMTVSGEERGLWGSTWYSEHPEFPLAQTVADLNTDMIGRYYNNQPGWRDTIVVIGKEHSSLGEVANRVAQEHPELHMQLIDDIWPSENFYRRSDHFNFARKGVPILFFFNGTHPDYHRAGDSVDKIDAEKEARIVRMVFYIGLDVANATVRPQWNPESRREIVEGAN
jgi:Zn-dependent M28 family amino/carboxypeptidase